MNQPPSLDEIRRQLTATFDDEGLTRLCYDHYQAVYHRFAAGMSLRRKARALTAYCDRQGLLPELLRQMNFVPSTPEAETSVASERGDLCYKNQLPPLTPSPGSICQRWALLVGINTLSGLIGLALHCRVDAPLGETILAWPCI